jgi:hypothetical protein
MASNPTGNWTGALLTGAGLWDQLDRYDEMKDQMGDQYESLTSDLIDRTDFTGFSVGGYGGGGSVDTDGNVTMSLNDEQQALADALHGYAGDFFGSAAGDQTLREENMYDKIRATQTPEEERQYHALESRLAAQGRLGLGSDMYGSSPEMLGYNKARGENMNEASLAAIEQARLQQLQDANIGTQFQTNSWMPQAQLMNLMNTGFQGAGLEQAGNLAGAGFQAQLGSDAIRGGVNAEKIRADIMMGLFNTAGQAFGDNQIDPVGGAIDWGWEKLFGEGGLFG